MTESRKGKAGYKQVSLPREVAEDLEALKAHLRGAIPGGTWSDAACVRYALRAAVEQAVPNAVERLVAAAERQAVAVEALAHNYRRTSDRE